jgi:benzoyl-CoA reductase/2-hydroxyglutaryl-CoA dehydratase subunit BcrC/BadD/HgdB
MKQFIEEKYGLPFLQIETGYAESDTEKLRIRIEAFLEMME